MSTIYQWKRKRMDNGGGVKIDDIEDLLKEIFVRLPPISVLTFKRVSKRWYSLISNPQFLRIHSIRFQCYAKHRIDLLMPGLFIKPFSNLLPSYHSQFIHLFPQYQHFSRLDFLDATHSVLPRTEGSWFVLVDSCNGLLLYQTHSKTPTYFVCNPITKQYIELPKLQQYENLLYNCNPHLVFDPSASLSYKVVKFSVHEGKTPNWYYQVDVYSSVTGSWKHFKNNKTVPQTDTVNYRTTYLLNGEGKTVLLNGVLYLCWRTANNLLCFDVENETTWYLPLPPKPMEYFRKLLYFGECGGQLRLIVRLTTSWDFRLTFPCSFDVFEAKQIKEPPKQKLASDIWVVRYRVVNMYGFDILMKIMKEPSDVHLLHYYKTGSKEKDEALLMNMDGRIFSYNLSCATFGKELIIPNSQPFTGYTDVLPYNATLFPLP